VPTLFRRKAIVIIETGEGQGLRIESKVSPSGLTGLDLSFKASKTLTSKPNSAEIAIWNLNESNRAAITERKNPVVKLEAGYEDETTMIFLGDMQEARIVRDGPDIITMISTSDGGKAHRKSRTNKAFGKGTSVATVASALIDSIGVGKGNVATLLASAGLEGVSTKFAGGVTLSGRSADLMARLAKSSGFEFSVQDGKAQFLRRGRPLNETAVKLSADTGLLKSPTRSSAGIVKASSLLIPDIYPGARVLFDTREVEGFYRVETAQYVGDTAGQEWAINMEAREI